MSYTLRLSAEERTRYRFMAQQARDGEVPEWTAAGVGPGARIADIGCGPGAMLRLLAETVGPGGAADGVDQDAAAVEAAGQECAGLAQASVRQGPATGSGLPPGSYDVVVCRHVLAHNGGAEAEIVAHLAALARPGGTVYLVDADLPATHIHPLDPELIDLTDRYVKLHRARGNDVTVGVKLGWLLEQAGLAVCAFRSVGPVFRLPPARRTPSWAARHALVGAGLATEDDLSRWERAFERMDRLPQRPWMIAPTYVALGQKPAA